MKKLVILALVFFMTSCSGAGKGFKRELEALGALAKEQSPAYISAFTKNTKSAKVYDQLETRALIKATYFSQQFIDAYINERKNYSSDVQAHLIEDRERQVFEKSVKFFVSFYTPNPDYNDLDKPNSIWQIYIQKTDGSKVAPLSIKKNPEPYPVLNYFFPTLDPWSIPYSLIFSREAVKSGEKVDLVFKSVLGSTKFVFITN